MWKTRIRWGELILVLAAGMLLAGVLCRVQQCQGVKLTGHDAELNDEDLSFLDEDEGEASNLDSAVTADVVESEAELGGAHGGQEDDKEINEFDEKDVVVLGSGNFSEFVKSTPYVLVEFYAHWCGHCKALAPEYAEAATILKGNAVLAKVDATANDELTEKYGVDSYPTLFFFVDGLHKPYHGGRVKDEIVAWVQKKTGPSVYRISSTKEAEKIFSSLKATMAVALLNSFEGSEAEDYTSAAKQVDRVYFFETDIAEAAEVFNIPRDSKRPALVLLKQELEKVSWFDGLFKRDAIEAFVTKNKLPLVTTFNKENAALIFESPIKKQVILLASADDYKKLISYFREASKALMGRLVFVHVDLNDSEQAPDILEFFGISGDNPVIMGYETEENGQKFLFEGEITAKNVKAFGESFLSGNLKPHLKSEPIPEVNDGDVRIVVGLNLDNIVRDETKDVFLEIYAPWCGHCQDLQPVWEKLAKRLRGVESIVIAKMDGTTNEHISVKADSYPTILLFPAGKNHVEPIPFEGERTLKGFVKFLKKTSTIPFTVLRNPEDLTRSDMAKAAADPSLHSVVEDSFNFSKDEL